MSSTTSTELLQHVVSRLADAPIQQSPFPHLVLTGVLPPEYFATLLAHVPPDQAFSPASYPGTGSFTSRHGGVPASSQGPRHHGLVLESWTHVPALAALYEALQHPDFSRVLLQKFSDPHSRNGAGPAIPIDKHSLFTNGASEHVCAVGLYKDMASYEISPHRDHPSKLVTFLLYIQDDREPPCGTMLCRPRAGQEGFADAADDYGAAKREGRSGLWLDWDRFDVVKEVRGANTLLAFAPNDISYHGVKLDGRAGERCHRTVVRGFIARRGYKDTSVLPASSDRAAASAHA
jgi:hypothetical protein